MITNSPKLFVEINTTDFIFTVGEKQNNNFKLLFSDTVPIQGILNNQISDLNLVCSILKKNIFNIEQKLNIVFKEAILILNNFNCYLINFSGYKKLNGSQLVKENITYIINSLKSKINEIEEHKTILHIFNSKYNLDKKNIENLPIGLFGEFYSHELSFFLINNNDYKNIRNIFNKCNLRIKKIISKNFIEGVNLINENSKLETFFKIDINKNKSQIIFFENSALKFTQNFDFGSDIIIKDISKIVPLKKEIIQNILKKINFSSNDLENELIENKFFQDQSFRKIKKKLLYDIALARIKELVEIILFKNINVVSFYNKNIPIFLKIEDKINIDCFQKIFIESFSQNKGDMTKLIDPPTEEIFYNDINKLVQYGWKKEAVPIIHEKKSIISRFFEYIFK